MSLPSLPAEDIFGNRKKIEYFLAHLDRHRSRLGRPLTILDFGCGNGTAMSAFLGNGPDRYYGVDFHPPSLAYARENFGGPQATFAEDVPPDVTFDALIYGDVIEHLPEPLELLQRHVAQLNDTGILLGSVPNGYGPCEMEKYVDRSLGLYEKFRWVGRRLGGLMGRPQVEREVIPYNYDSGHLQFFTIRSLNELVANLGMRIADFGHGGFVGANLTAATIFRSPRLVDLNVKVADHLPDWMVSTWYFELDRKR